MIIKEYLRGILLLAISILVSTTNVNQIYSGNKGLNDRCKWNAVGTQCQRGLQCSKIKGICLKKRG